MTTTKTTIMETTTTNMKTTRQPSITSTIRPPYMHQLSLICHHLSTNCLQSVNQLSTNIWSTFQRPGSIVDTNLQKDDLSTISQPHVLPGGPSVPRPGTRLSNPTFSNYGRVFFYPPYLKSAVLFLIQARLKTNTVLKRQCIEVKNRRCTC